VWCAGCTRLAVALSSLHLTSTTGCRNDLQPPKTALHDKAWRDHHTDHHTLNPKPGGYLDPSRCHQQTLSRTFSLVLARDPVNVTQLYNTLSHTSHLSGVQLHKCFPQQLIQDVHVSGVGPKTVMYTCKTDAPLSSWTGHKIQGPARQKQPSSGTTAAVQQQAATVAVSSTAASP
jgi:hypothetical protein